jgi:hypothetical protein
LCSFACLRSFLLTLAKAQGTGFEAWFGQDFEASTQAWAATCVEHPGERFLTDILKQGQPETVVEFGSLLGVSCSDKGLERIASMFECLRWVCGTDGGSQNGGPNPTAIVNFAIESYGFVDSSFLESPSAGAVDAVNVNHDLLWDSVQFDL